MRLFPDSAPPNAAVRDSCRPLDRAASDQGSVLPQTPGLPKAIFYVSRPQSDRTSRQSRASTARLELEPEARMLFALKI